MDLSEKIEQAARRQANTKSELENKIVRTVNLGQGRISNYGYNGVGRPTNEGYGCDDIEGNILNG